ncbi:MAG TPA: monovalent cation/H+ antiporter subunit D [Noviherbaspirillum sp.]|nr:monovalent cation/H+ antiporter subunit D [Noviherbaspirillum sp.]
MGGWLQHLPILPIVLPLLAGAALLLIDDGRYKTRTAVAIASVIAQLAVAIALLAVGAGVFPDLWPTGVAVYKLGGWEAPFGIVLVADRLSAVMLTLAAVLAIPSLVYASARWDKIGAHFHTLFQLLLMGLNGAFLTGDLFNLFVFFEVLLAASYGLVLHGSGARRVKAGLHYIVVNLAASLLFLLGAALIYGVTGTLNMADLAMRVPRLDADGRLLFDVGVALLGVVFLIKAGVWPLNFWLQNSYSAAAAPVAAIFSIMTKVGIYAVLRIGTLLSLAGAPAPFDGNTLWIVGIATLFFGAIAMLNEHQPQRLAACCVIVSAGTLLSALGLGGPAVVGAALFYLISSALATGAFFMLGEMIERSQQFGAGMLAVSLDYFGIDEAPDPNAPEEVVGVAIPAALAFLGLGFISCALLITGLPPLSGFIAKFSLLSATLGDASLDAVPPAAWALVVGVLGSGMIGIIALSRMGTRIFWNSGEWRVPHLRVIEAGPVVLLVMLCVGLTMAAGPVAKYLDATGLALYQPHSYIDAVLAGQQASVTAVAGGGR